jgi:hypothetical protein
MNDRDFVIARLGIVQVLLRDCSDQAHEAISLFLDPVLSEDTDGVERMDQIGIIEELLREAALAAQRAREGMAQISDEELVLSENEDGEQDEDLDEDPDDEDPDDPGE